MSDFRREAFFNMQKQIMPDTDTTETVLPRKARAKYLRDKVGIWMSIEFLGINQKAIRLRPWCW